MDRVGLYGAVSPNRRLESLSSHPAPVTVSPTVLMSLHSEWRDCGRSWLWLGQQATPEWQQLRRGRITATSISKVCGRSAYHAFNKSSNEGFAKALLGVEGYSTLGTRHDDPDTLERMRWGSDNEEVARRLFLEAMKYREPEHLEVTVSTEIGLAVDKVCQYFSASVDSDIVAGVPEPSLLEIKCPQRMAMDCCVDHYDQVQMNGALLNKKHGYYFSLPKYLPSGQLNIWDARMSFSYYLEKVPIVSAHYYQVLRPGGLRFWEQYMQPLIDRDPLLRPLSIPPLA
jgi:hypothetical protein